MPNSERERLDCIISYCCIEMGKLEWAKLNEKQKNAWRDDPPVAQLVEAKANLIEPSHLHALIGASRLNVTIRDAPSTSARHTRLSHFLATVEQKHGRDVQVRLAKDLVFETRDEEGLSYPELTVLAAIYSKIGSTRSPVRITRNEIWRRAQGYKSKLAFLRDSPVQPPYLTPRKVRSLIESLHDRGFFARATYARRQTFYSHRLSSNELVSLIFEQKTRKARARHARIAANDALTKAIAAERRKLANPCSQGTSCAATGVATAPPLK